MLEQKETLEINTYDAVWTRWVMQTARTWDDISFIVKKTEVDIIDNDHQKLVEYALMINSLIDRMNTDEFSLELIEEQRKVLKMLYAFTEEHFDREQALMKKYKIPGAKRQNEEHIGILKMLQSILDDFNAGKVTISLNLKIAILEWVILHLNDRDYNDFQLKNWSETIEQSTTWDEISVKVRNMDMEKIDDDHKVLSEYVMEINEYVNLSKEEQQKPNIREKILAFFEKVEDFATQHFALEEEFIALYSLQGIEDQQEQHEQFSQMLQTFKEQFAAGELVLSKKLKVAILSWWIAHINKYDYKTFCVENWGEKVFEQAETWNDVAHFVKKTHIAVIDEDHRHVIEASLELNHVLGEMSHEQDIEGLQQKAVVLLEKLHVTSKEHFDREEILIKEKNFPNLSLQQDQHRKFLKLLNEYMEDFKANRIAVSMKLKVRILDWWISHTNKIDYMTFVEKRTEDVATSGMQTDNNKDQK